MLQDLTPKEKAKELYDKAESYIYTSQAHFAAEDCDVNCAMMVVDGILELIRYHGTDIGQYTLRYWLDVKEELIKLQEL